MFHVGIRRLSDWSSSFFFLSGLPVSRTCVVKLLVCCLSVTLPLTCVILPRLTESIADSIAFEAFVFGGQVVKKIQKELFHENGKLRKKIIFAR